MRCRRQLPHAGITTIMARTGTIDLEVLRGPLPDGSPGGINLRIDDRGRAAWGGIRDARDEARRIERESDQDRSVERGAALGPWGQVADRCSDVLTSMSRDLGAAAALIESWARLDGFAGLANGCDVARALVESHWADLFPIPDPEDGPADDRTVAQERALPLVRLVGEESEGLLVPAILYLPLVDGRDGQRYGLCHWRSSRDLRGIDDTSELERALARGATSPEQFQAAVASTGKPFLQQVFRDVLRARESWDSLAVAVAGASNDLAILPALPLRDLFEECEAALRTFAPEAIEEVLRTEAPAATDGAAPATTGEISGTEAGVLAGRPTTRDDALAWLERAADFFERSDPHSLLAAQIRNVVRMARLSREEYYREMIRESEGLKALSRMIGTSFEE
jgi:type VI secretion system protein ImpA